VKKRLAAMLARVTATVRPASTAKPIVTAAGTMKKMSLAVPVTMDPSAPLRRPVS